MKILFTLLFKVLHVFWDEGKNRKNKNMEIYDDVSNLFCNLQNEPWDMESYTLLSLEDGRPLLSSL